MERRLNLGPAYTYTFTSVNAYFLIRLHRRPHVNGLLSYPKCIHSKTLSKVDTFENAVFTSPSGRP